MENQFVIPKLALSLKEIGFDGECFGIYQNGLVNYNQHNIHLFRQTNMIGDDCLAPTWQQVFDWFEEKYSLYSSFDKVDNTKHYYYDFSIVDSNDREYHDEDCIDQAKRKSDYKEYDSAIAAKIACIEKLIEIAKSINLVGKTATIINNHYGHVFTISDVIKIIGDNSKLSCNGEGFDGFWKVENSKGIQDYVHLKDFNLSNK